ncbi:MAG: hypothetical protein M1822_004620 [Bathelium mastoideum]|nr:MAG: hypothetical protein M1822_004620 [Bathelium mastoideum]
MKKPKGSLAKRSLTREKPWDRKKYPDKTPPGWEWDSTSKRWNDPPETWRFNRRFKYWFQVPICKQYLEGRCKNGKDCRKLHSPSSPLAMEEGTHSIDIETSSSSSPDTPSQGTPSDGNSVKTCPTEVTSTKETLLDPAQIDEGTRASLSTEEAPTEDIPTKRPEISPKGGEDPTKTTIEDILHLKGFKNVSKSIREIQWRTELWKRQGVNLKDKCGSMNIIILQKQGSENLRAAEIYHKYLDDSGYFPAESEFLQVSGNSDDPSSDSYFVCSTWPESGTVFVDNAGELNRWDRDKTTSKTKICQNVVVVLAIEADRLTTSFNELKSLFPLQLDLTAGTNESGGDRVQLAQEMLLKHVEKEFSGRMKLEGGPDGPYVRAFVRKVMDQCNRSKDFDDVVYAALQKVYMRQIERLRHRAETRLRDETSNPPDELLISKEDIFGPPPDVDTLQGDAWNELQNMIGLDAAKSSLKSFLNGSLHNYYRQLQGQDPLQIGLSRLFIGPPGTGKTTVARLYGQILADLGFLSSGKLIIKSATDFIGEYIGQSTARTQDILEEGRGNVLVIDEAYMLDSRRNNGPSGCPFRQEVTDTIVKEVENKPGEDLCVIMCGYKDEMENFIQNANPGLRRRFPIDDAFIFEDFSEECLGAVLDLKMRQQHLSTTEQGRTAALEALKLAKQRPNFGNGGEVDNVLARAITNFRNRFQELPADMRSADVPLTEFDFDPEHSRSLHAEDEVDRQFKDFIGLDAQIDIFRSFARQVKNIRKWKWNADPKLAIPFSFIFKGPPGCGKTTAARKIGHIYYHMGLLAKPEVVEASVKDMVAEYVGQTVSKTRLLMESALGKVLFIDEAYRLTGEEKVGCFIKEAREELVDAMTKPKFLGNVVIILAGYESNMNNMLSTNPGLASRFGTTIRFCNLSSGACIKLLQKKIETSIKDLRVEVVFGEHEEMIKEIFERFDTIDDWGNGRDVESIAMRIIRQLFESPAAPPIADGLLILDVLRKWSAERYPFLPLPRDQRAIEEVEEHPSDSNTASGLAGSAPTQDLGRLGKAINCPQEAFNATNPGNKNLYTVPLDQSRKEIRLLSILPDVLPRISCKLRIVALVGRPRFYALSYVWGNPTDTITIEVNGESVAVTKNLESALRRLSEFENGKYSNNIWIDALCIDQSDLDEKAYQVLLMGEIYFDTERVIGWLGQDDESSDAAFKVLRRALERKAENTLDDSSATDMFFDLTATFTDRSPFWERIWIVQEMCLPKSSPILLSRESSMPLDQISDGLNMIIGNKIPNFDVLIERVGYKSYDGLLLKKDTDEIFTTLTYMSSLSNLREMFQNQIQSRRRINAMSFLGRVTLLRKTSHPSDRVYALLGMYRVMDKKFQNVISIDYGAHYMSAYQGFLRTVWASDDLDFLSLIDYLPARLRQNHYPSWVADLSHQPLDLELKFTLNRTDRWERGSPAEFSDDGKLIFAEGVVMDNISSSVTFPGFYIPDDNGTFHITRPAIRFFRNLELEIADTKKEAAASIELKECIMKAFVPSSPLWKSLLPNIMDSVGNAPSELTEVSRKRLHLFSRFWREVISQPSPAVKPEHFLLGLCEPDRCQLRAIWEIFVSQMDTSGKAQKIIITSSGICGVARAESETADVLVMLHGFVTPMVLRKQENGQYTIIGPASIEIHRDRAHTERLLDDAKVENQRFIIA